MASVAEGALTGLCLAIHFLNLVLDRVLLILKICDLLLEVCLLLTQILNTCPLLSDFRFEVEAVDDFAFENVVRLGANEGHRRVGPIVFQLTLERVAQKFLRRLIVDSSLNRCGNPLEQLELAKMHLRYVSSHNTYNTSARLHVVGSHGSSSGVAVLNTR